ncbi:unnamed protein product [Rhizoctonia solani]|nr:unnamed protein product [Rhizoctonia solani]
MSTSSNGRCVTINQWEDAGTSLVAELGNYMDLSLNLAPNSLGEHAKPSEIATRIDPTLKSIYKQMTQMSSTLARTRNRLVSPILQFPDEIISAIFVNYVFGPMISKPPLSPSMTREVWQIQYRLDRLIRVCSSWRDILMANGSFRSIIPVITSSFSKRSPLEYSLQRAGGCQLYLAATDGGWQLSKPLLKVLTEYGSRFRAINLNTGDRDAIKGAMHKVLEQSTTGLLTELSIRWINEYVTSPALPNDPDYILPRNHPKHASFTDILGSLTAFRISGMQFHWDAMVFSTRLVELRIDSVTLGYDDAIISFLRALSLASELRDLKIISVSTFCRPGAAPDMGALSAIRFPNLQSLLLQDLYLNTLQILLPAFTPARHCLTLFLTGLCLKVNMLQSDELGGGQAQQSEQDRAADLCTILQPYSLDTLTLGEHSEREVWLRGAASHTLLKGLPTLKTLKLHNWIFELSEWEDLTRPRAARENPQEYPFAALENLYMASAKIRCQYLDVVEEMVTSHPLRRVVLGGVYQTLTSSQTYNRSLEESTVVESLQHLVPEFQLVDKDCFPEFDWARWRLW